MTSARKTRAAPVTELAEIAAWRDIFEAVPAKLAAAQGIAVSEVNGVFCTAVEAMPEALMVNRAVGFGIGVEGTEETLADISVFFASRNLRFALALAPGAQPRQTVDWLSARRFEAGYAWAKFVRPGGAAPAAGPLSVERAGPDRAEVFGRVVAEGYGGLPGFFAEWAAALVGRPGWRCYLALDGNEPAAAAALYSSGRAGWLGLMAALPEHRGKGAQRSLMAARIRDAAALGCDVVITETGEQVEGRPDFSYRNILRAGFRLEYVRPNWVSPR
jgi:GNAT superfamily N-acetyltransferase